jgi:hypothetical protein
MSKARLALLTLTAALSVVALSAASASARISFEWFVGGSLLASGERRAYDLNTDGHTFDFNLSLGGAEVLILSNKISVQSAQINGGRPGTSEGALVFENVVVDKPAGCLLESLPNLERGIVKTKLLKAEIVEGQNGEVLLLFAPALVGEPFTTLLFLNRGTETCPGANIPTQITGGLLALPSPQRTEVLRQDLTFPSVEQRFLLAAGGALQTTGLRFGGAPLTLTGLTLVLLTSDEAFAPF